MSKQIFIQAFVSYLRSIYLHKDKTIFKLEDLPVDKFAESLGLPGTPKIKFLSKATIKAKKNASRVIEAAQAEALKGGGSSDEESGEETSSGDEEEDEPEKPQPAKPAKVSHLDNFFYNFFVPLLTTSTEPGRRRTD